MSNTTTDDGQRMEWQKQGAIDAQARRKSHLSLCLAIYLGLLVLLITVTVMVLARAPNFPSDPAFIVIWNKRHLSSFYFTEAKSLVRPLVLTSIEKKSRQLLNSNAQNDAQADQSSWAIVQWSRESFDADSSCIEIGNGVWQAVGTVRTRSSKGGTALRSWTIYFVAESATPLFVKVGDLESGDLTQALNRARSNPAMGNTSP